jgi:hypothetical protein
MVGLVLPRTIVFVMVVVIVAAMHAVASRLILVEVVEACSYIGSDAFSLHCLRCPHFAVLHTTFVSWLFKSPRGGYQY